MSNGTGQLELEETSKDQKETNACNYEEAAQLAVNETGFGRFNFKIAIVSNLIYMNISASILSLGFILPASSCDLQMTNIDKGYLSASAMFGMLCGSYLWGCIADMKGRRISLIVAIFFHGLAEFVASMVPFFWGFLFLKFISGFALNGELTVIFTYLGEFQPIKYRDRLLSLLETFWIVGMLLSTGMSWAIIPLNIHYEYSTFFIHSWNILVLALSLPPLAFGLTLIFLPETPKYLAETRQDAKLLDVLTTMYIQNTGNPPKQYIATLKNSANKLLTDMIARVEQKQEQSDDGGGKSFAAILGSIYTQTITVIRRPYLKQTILICTATALIMSSYYSLTLWLPELFRRLAAFDERYPNQSVGVCDVTHVEQKANATLADPFNCHETIHTDVYVHTLIIGAACIPTGLTIPLLVDRLGYKFILVFTSILPGLVTIGFFLAKSSLQTLILSCIFESFTSVSLSLVLCMLVDMYPTHLRATAAGLTAFFSRAGAIAGNLLIGALIDNYCALLIFIIAAKLLVSGILIAFIPGRKQLIDRKDDKNTKENKAM